MEKNRIEQIATVAAVAAAVDLADDVGGTVEELIPRIETIAYLVESIGTNVGYTGVPSDPDIVVSASTYLSDSLMEIAKELKDILDRIAKEFMTDEEGEQYGN